MLENLIDFVLLMIVTNTVEETPFFKTPFLT